MQVRHIANESMVLEVVWTSPKGKVPMGGVPAVTMLDDEYFAGEIIEGDILAAVDLLPSLADAMVNAKRRDWRERA
jgi:hypothetical protein